MTKRMASLSIDLDDMWTYMKTAGLPGWQEYPSYLDIAIPRIRRCLERNDVRLTVFVVGRDAARPGNRSGLAGFAQDGHEIGSHSFDHESWLSRRPREVIDADLGRAEEAIDDATGLRPTGFRGPSFGLSSNLIDVLLDRGYRYDASTFPTFLGPVARAYYNVWSKDTKMERDARKLLFGSLADGLRPIKPYTWQVGDRSLIEMPVTTFPILRAPIHFTYLVFLAALSPMLARAYFSSALRACRATGVEPSLLLHPLEFLDAAEAPPLRAFPGMGIPASVKIDLIDWCLRRLSTSFRVVPVGHHAETVGARRSLGTRQPDFAADRSTLAPLAT